jgi:hypothetical protein
MGMDFIAFPIPDRGVPSSFRATLALIQRLEMLLKSGKSIGIHCRQGVGRSGLLAASLLVHSGEDVGVVFQRVESARGLPVPETKEQRDWVSRFAREVFAASRGEEG